MTIKVRNTADGAELLLYGEVGWEIDGRSVIEALGQVGDGDVLVRVNSPGGDAYEGVAVMNALRAHPGRVTVVVEALAASAASVIAVGGGDRVVMRPASELMIHDAWALTSGDAAELQKAIDRLDAMSEMIAQVYADKAGTDAAMWREAMRAETWFSAEEALSAGLVDAVEDGRDSEIPVAAAGKMSAVFNYAGRRFAPRPDALVNARRGREEDDEVSFKTEIAQRLGIVEAADEATVLAALDVALQRDDDGGAAAADGDAAGAEAADEATGEAAGESTGEGVGDDADSTGAGPDGCEDGGPGDGVDDEGDDEGDGSESALDDTVTLDADVYRDLLERAARGDAAEGEAQERRAEELVAAAIRDGKVLAAKREALVAAAIEDYDAMKAKIDSLVSGIIPVAEKGRGGSDEARGVDENGRMARRRRAVVSAALRPAV